MAKFINQFFRAMTSDSDINWMAYPVRTSSLVNPSTKVSEVIQALNLKTLDLPVYEGPIVTSNKPSLLFAVLPGGGSYIHFKTPAKDHASRNLYVKLTDVVAIFDREALVFESVEIIEDNKKTSKDNEKTSWIKGFFSKSL